MQFLLKAFKKNKIFYSLIFLIATIKGVYFSHFGFNIYDYGETLDNASRILRGDIFYRDIWSFFPPGFGYLPAAIFLIFGKSFLIIRYVESFFFALLVLMLLLISKEFLSRKLLFLLSLVLIFSDLNTYLFFYYVFFFSPLYFIILYFKLQKRYLLALSGLILGIGSFFRHDTTLITLVTIIIILWLAYKNKLIKKLAGSFSVLLAVFLAVAALPLFVINNFWSLKDFFYTAFIKAPQITRNLSSGLDTNRLFSEDFSSEKLFLIFTLFFYLVYVVVYLLIILKLRKKWDKKRSREKVVIICLLLFGLLQLPHAFSVFEMGHLVKAGLSAFLLGFYLVQEQLKKTSKFLTKTFIFAPIIIFLLGNLVMSLWWVRFNDTKVNFPSGAVNVNSSLIPASTYATADTIKKTAAFIQNNTEKNEYIFVAPFHSIFYFLTDRKNPTRFSNFAGGIISPEDEVEVISLLKNKNVKIIVYDPINAPLKKSFSIYAPKVHNYIMENFYIVEKTNEGWLFMRRKI